MHDLIYRNPIDEAVLAFDAEEDGVLAFDAEEDGVPAFDAEEDGVLAFDAEEDGELLDAADGDPLDTEDGKPPNAGLSASARTIAVGTDNSRITNRTSKTGTLDPTNNILCKSTMKRVLHTTLGWKIGTLLGLLLLIRQGAELYLMMGGTTGDPLSYAGRSMPHTQPALMSSSKVEDTLIMEITSSTRTTSNKAHGPLVTNPSEGEPGYHCSAMTIPTFNNTSTHGGTYRTDSNLTMTTTKETRSSHAPRLIVGRLQTAALHHTLSINALAINQVQRGICLGVYHDRADTCRPDGGDHRTVPTDKQRTLTYGKVAKQQASTIEDRILEKVGSKAVSMIKGVVGAICTGIRYSTKAIWCWIVHPASRLVARKTPRCPCNSMMQSLGKKMLTMVHWLRKTKSKQPGEKPATNQHHLPNLYNEPQIARVAQMVGQWKRPSYPGTIYTATRHRTQTAENGNSPDRDHDPIIATPGNSAPSHVNSKQEGTQHWTTQKIGALISGIMTDRGWHKDTQGQGRSGNQEVFSGSQEGFFRTVFDHGHNRNRMLAPEKRTEIPGDRGVLMTKRCSRQSITPVPTH